MLFLSCPNTEGNGYNTQYRAHVYEWGYNELKTALNNLGFTIESEYDIPYIAKLLVEDKISLHTACILQYLTRWADKCHSPIIDDVLFQVRKSYRFFKLNEVEVKGMIIDHYKEKVEA